MIAVVDGMDHPAAGGEVEEEGGVFRAGGEGERSDLGRGGGEVGAGSGKHDRDGDGPAGASGDKSSAALQQAHAHRDLEGLRAAAGDGGVGCGRVDRTTRRDIRMVSARIPFAPFHMRRTASLEAMRRAVAALDPQPLALADLSHGKIRFLVMGVNPVVLPGGASGNRRMSCEPEKVTGYVDSALAPEERAAIGGQCQDDFIFCLGLFDFDFNFGVGMAFHHHMGTIVETDGDADHLARTARHRDRRRDARLTAAGYTVLRFGWEQVVGRPDEVAAALNAALQSGSAVFVPPERAQLLPIR